MMVNSALPRAAPGGPYAGQGPSFPDRKIIPGNIHAVQSGKRKIIERPLPGLLARVEASPFRVLQPESGYFSWIRCKQIRRDNGLGFSRDNGIYDGFLAKVARVKLGTRTAHKNPCVRPLLLYAACPL